MNQTQQTATQPLVVAENADNDLVDSTPSAAREERKVADVKPGRLFIQAYACDDDADGPEWAVIEDPLALLAQAQKLEIVVEENRLSEARVWASPDAWGPAGVEDDLGLTGDELVVTSDSFWFTCLPTHADYNCETRALRITALAEALAKAAPGEDVYLGSNDDELKQRIIEEDDECDPVTPSM